MGYSRKICTCYLVNEGRVIVNSDIDGFLHLYNLSQGKTEPVSSLFQENTCGIVYEIFCFNGNNLFYFKQLEF